MGESRRKRKQKTFFFKFSRPRAVVSFAYKKRHRRAVLRYPPLTCFFASSLAPLVEKKECFGKVFQGQINQRKQKMMKIRRSLSLSVSLSLQFAFYPLQHHLRLVPPRDCADGKKEKSHQSPKNDRRRRRRRKSRQKKKLRSLSLISLQPFRPLAPALPLHALRRLVPRRVLQDSLEQLRAPERVGEREVALGRRFRLRRGVVVELPGPLAVHVELALDPVDRLEELVPPAD